MHHVLWQRTGFYRGNWGHNRLRIFGSLLLSSSWCRNDQLEFSLCHTFGNNILRHSSSQELWYETTTASRRSTLMQIHRASLLHHMLPLQMTSAFAGPAGLQTLFLTWGTANFKSALVTLNKKPQHVFSFQSRRKKGKAYSHLLEVRTWRFLMK